MRLFVLLGALVVAGGVYLGLSGAIQANKCLTFGTFSMEVWSAHFWLLSPDKPGLGLGPNGHWLLRILGCGVAVYLGGKLIKFSTK